MGALSTSATVSSPSCAEGCVAALSASATRRREHALVAHPRRRAESAQTAARRRRLSCHRTRMQHRPISRAQRAQRRRRRQQHARLRSRRPPRDSRPATTAAPGPARSDRLSVALLQHRAIGQLLHAASAADAAASCRRSSRSRCSTASISRARRSGDAIALLPRRAKPVGVVAAAEEARAMAGRERGGLVEKEQLGPAAAAHHLAPPAPEFADAGEPRRARPAPRQQVLVAGSWMMPRLPVNIPRCGVAMMSPVGVTRFCSGIW